MVPVTTPDAFVVPDMEAAEPESGANVPAITPPLIVKVKGPESVAPLDCVPVHVPSYVPSNWPTPVLVVNVAVTVLFPLIVTEHGLPWPAPSPPQPVNADPASAV